MTQTALDKPRQLRIGTRGSKLALWQAHHVRDRLEALGCQVEIETIQTQGDRIDHLPFSKMEGKGFFTKELEQAQVDGRVDIAVHSMKDLTTESPSGLAIGAMIGRADARDLLLANESAVDAKAIERGDLLPLLADSRVGTSSVRRQMQLQAFAQQLDIRELRGNVPTRLRKLREGPYDAIIVAKAGVDRLGLNLDGLLVRPLDPLLFVPAPAQGMLAVQCRDEPGLRAVLAQIHDAEAARAVLAERDLLARLQGGCQLPFGCHISVVAGGRFGLSLFLSQAEQPLQLRLEGEEPERLVELAWHEITHNRIGNHG